jgi:MoaA/NifB/PqqE/SkfB family radical SAM enzyme
MNFPQCITLTITNTCNLRCKMCGQWSEEGYMHCRADRLKQEMSLADWKKIVDELAGQRISSVLLRGGEPFLFPGIIELVEYIHNKGMFVAIDTNGTMLKDHARDLIRLGGIHLTISVDGPEEIHDQVRGVKGCFSRIKENAVLLHELEKNQENQISKSICFTISPYSYQGLGQMPEVARSLFINSVAIVPYYYFPGEIGKQYEKELRENLGCPAFCWQGFHHESSGIDFNIFKEEYRKYLANLGNIRDYPYMKFSENDYRVWFGDSLSPIGSLSCSNVEKLIDIQPNGDVNFCVDFPDYIIGNARTSGIAEIWNGERAERFRRYRREKPLPVCFRCGVKYMSEMEE